VGLGAIGGSVARRAAAEGVDRIIGYARHRPDAIAAAKAGAITDVATTLEQAVRGAEFVVLAASPGSNLDLLGEVAKRTAGGETILTDVASVKRPITERAVELGVQARFAGSHPLAGTHASGFEASDTNLFEGVVVYVTPVKDGERAHDEVVDFWQRTMGAHPVTIAAEQHDQLLAWTSHLPQSVASALAVAMAEQGPRGATFGPGARSTTRLAASGSDMWTDVLMQNREPMLQALDGLAKAQGELREALEARDEERLRAWLQRGAQWRRGIDQ